MQRLLPLAVFTGLLVLGARAQSVHDEANALLCLDRSELLRLDLPAAVGGPLVLEVELDGVADLLDLRPWSNRAADFRVLEVLGDGSTRAVDPGPVRTLRGELVGDPGSRVAAAHLDDGLWARIRTSAGEDWWIEPLAGRVRGADVATHVLYAGVDSDCAGGWCGTEALPGFEDVLDDGEVGVAGESVWVAEIAADCDFPFHNAWGGTSGAVGRVTAVLSAMNLQYEGEVNITHQLTAILVRTSSASDPYTTSDPNALLSQFKQQWGLNHGDIQRDVAELFTGRNLDGSVIGIAYPGGICTPGLGYNVVQNYGNLSCATDLSAHELGHNWNATHCSCNGYTMNPFLTCGNKFTDVTATKIIGFRKTRDCLDLTFDGTQLFFDDFESGDLTAGGWTRKNNKSNARGQAAYRGKFGARINRQSWLAKAISTAGAAAVQVEFSYRVRQYEAGETLTVEWSGDGGATWNTVANLASDTWVDQASFALPAGAANNPAFVLRFSGGGVGKNTATGKNKRAHVDDVRIIVE